MKALDRSVGRLLRLFTPTIHVSANDLTRGWVDALGMLR